MAVWGKGLVPCLVVCNLIYPNSRFRKRGKKMIQLSITRQHKTAGNKSDWQTYDHQMSHLFETLAEAKDWLKDEYWYSHTKRPMYVDGKDGKPQKVGYVISFKTDPVSYDDKHGFDQHWIHFYKVTNITI